MPAFDWSAINTALLIGSLAYIWRQSRIVDQLRQALVGMGAEGDGLIGEVKLLRTRSHELANKMAELAGTVQQLTIVMEERKLRRE